MEKDIYYNTDIMTDPMQLNFLILKQNFILWPINRPKRSKVGKHPSEKLCSKHSDSLFSIKYIFFID